MIFKEVHVNPDDFRSWNFHFLKTMFLKDNRIKNLLRQTQVNENTTRRWCILRCDPAGIRTQDHYIKSVMLYQLSYGIEKVRQK